MEFVLVHIKIHQLISKKGTFMSLTLNTKVNIKRADHILHDNHIMSLSKKPKIYFAQTCGRLVLPKDLAQRFNSCNGPMLLSGLRG